jgi:Pyridoxamine 5'-phosphate oxidase
MMTLATIRSDGFPQATTVNYIHDGFNLYLATDAASQKAGNNKVSVAIASETDNFYKLRGLSMSGLATSTADTIIAYWLTSDEPAARQRRCLTAP